MKTGVHSALHVIISNLAILCCFAPILLLASKKIRQVTAYKILGIYWMLNGLVDLFNLDINPLVDNPALRDKLIFWYDMIDTPLVLLIFGTAVKGREKAMFLWTMFAYVASELVLLGWKGHAFLNTYMFCATGPLLVVIGSAVGLVQYMRRVEHSPVENVMAFTYAAMLFAYGSFLIIFTFMPSQDTDGNYNDTFLLYYISSLLSVAVTILGLCSYGFSRRSYSSSSS